MIFMAILPQDQSPHPQLARWTMLVDWEPRVFFRVRPDVTYDETCRQFICHSQHWSDKLFILENRELTDKEYVAFYESPKHMAGKGGKALHMMGTEDCKTIMIRRDAFDIFEGIGLNDNWFTDQMFNFLELGRRAGMGVAIYDEPLAKPVRLNPDLFPETDKDDWQEDLMPGVEIK